MRDTLLDGADSMHGQLQPSPHKLPVQSGSRRTVATLPPRDKGCWRFHTDLRLARGAGGEAIEIRALRLYWAAIRGEVTEYSE